MSTRILILKDGVIKPASSSDDLGIGGSSLTLGVTSITAYRGDYGELAYAHSQITSGNPHGLTLNSLVGTQTNNRVLRSNGTSTTLSQVSLTTDVINILPASLGGSGQSSYTIGDILFASTSTALSKLVNVATGNTLISSGVGVAPSYGKVGLTTHISGVLPIANGGTGSATQNFVDLTATQTVGGVKTFTAPTAITNTTASTSTTTGALVVNGGTAVGGNLSIGGSLNGASTEAHGSITLAGSKAGWAGIHLSGGFGNPVFMHAAASTFSGVWSASEGWSYYYIDGSFIVFNKAPHTDGSLLGLYKGLGSLPGFPTNRYPTVRTDFATLYFSAGGVYSSAISAAGVYTAQSNYYEKEIIEEEIDSNVVLEKIKHLPVARYCFKSESSEIQRIGTFAQAFWLAFQCGGSDENVVDASPTSPDKQMSSADVAGVCLAGIKGLINEIEDIKRRLGDTIEITFKGK